MIDLTYLLNRLAGTTGLPEGRALDAAVDRLRLAGAGVLGLAQITANVTGASGDVAGLSVAVTAGSSRRLKVTGYATLQGSTAGGFVEVKIQEGATILGLWRQTFSHASGHLTAAPLALLTPTAGAHTYKITVGVSGTTVDVLAAATAPASLLVEDIGAA